MRTRVVLRCLMVAVVGFPVAVRTCAGGHGCAQCGCTMECEKVCRLVCEEKKVEVVCWGCKSEDFCNPGPSKPGSKHCEPVCGNCGEQADPKEPHSAPKKFVWREWIPGCAKVYTNKKLMKLTTTKTIPSYKWVVEELCRTCAAKCASATPAAGAEIPPAPAGDAKVVPVRREEPTDPEQP